MIGLRFGIILSLGALTLSAQTLRDYEKKVTEFTLANRLHFIVVERHQVPVVSFHTLVLAGTGQDPSGQSGLAHLLEHMAFQGTEAIGTKNWPAEKKLLEDVEDTYDQYLAERARGARASAVRLADLETRLIAGTKEAQTFSDSGEFERILRENGSVGLSSHTTADTMETLYSLPSNRLELWFLMESQRLARPVMRDFYQKRTAVQSEYQATVDGQPLLKLQQLLLATAFSASPYATPALGWPAEEANLRVNDAKAFLDSYAVPGNTVISIVGDVDPAAVQKLAERYFGPIMDKPIRSHDRADEPPQSGPKTAVLLSNSQPTLMVGYKRPNQYHRDDLAFDVLRLILSDGTSGLLYKELVEGRKIALAADAVPAFPGNRLTSLFVFTVVPANNHSVQEAQAALDELLARFSSKPVDAATLTRVKNSVRTNLVRGMASNQQLAANLAVTYIHYGDWKKIFTLLDDLEKLDPKELQRVSVQYFVPFGRTIVYSTVALSGSAMGAAQ